MAIKKEKKITTDIKSNISSFPNVNLPRNKVMGETKLLTEIFFRKSKYEVHGYKIILCLKILGVFNFNLKKKE